MRCERPPQPRTGRRVHRARSGYPPEVSASCYCVEAEAAVDRERLSSWPTGSARVQSEASSAQLVDTGIGAVEPKRTSMHRSVGLVVTAAVGSSAVAHPSQAPAQRAFRVSGGYGQSPTARANAPEPSTSSTAANTAVDHRGRPGAHHPVGMTPEVEAERDHPIWTMPRTASMADADTVAGNIERSDA